MIQLAKCLLLSGVLVVFVSCEEGENSSPATNEEQERINRIARTWEADQVVYEGSNVTDVDFANFTITFNEDNTWTTEDGDPAFASSGTWEFAEDNVNIIIMNGVEVLTNTSTDGELLRLEFVLVGATVGRTAGLEGEYIFDLSLR